MQLRNEWNKTPLLFKFFNFVFLVLLWLCDFAVLGLRPWRAQKALLGILRRVLGRGREIPHSPQLVHKSSITLATQAAARLNEQSRDWLVPIRLLLLGGSAKWRIRDAQERPRVALESLSNFVRSCSGVQNQRRCQHLTNAFGGMGVRLELTEPLWWRCNNLSQANPPFNGYQKK